MRFECLSGHHIGQAMISLDRRLGKCLNCKMPHEVFMKQLQLHLLGVHFEIASAGY